MVCLRLALVFIVLCMLYFFLPFQNFPCIHHSYNKMTTYKAMLFVNSHLCIILGVRVFCYSFQPNNILERNYEKGLVTQSISRDNSLKQNRIGTNLV